MCCCKTKVTKLIQSPQIIRKEVEGKKRRNVCNNKVIEGNSKRRTHVAFKDFAFLEVFKGEIVSQEHYTIDIDL